MQRRHHVECRGVAVGVLALRQRARFLTLRPACYEREQFEQGIRCRRQRNIIGQYLAQRLAFHFGGVRCAKHGDNLVHEPEFVAGKNAEGIADDIVEAAAAKIEIDVPGFLFRSGLVQEAA